MKTGSVKQGNFSYVRSSVAQLSLPFVALIVMSAVFACINPNFLAVENTASLLRHIAPMLIIGIGQSYVLISGGIDLSIGSVVCLSNLFTVNLAREFHSISPALSCIIALFCGCLIGLLNGILIAKAKFPPAIATLGTWIIAHGIAWLTVRRSSLGWIKSETIRQLLWYGKTFGLFNPVWIAIVLFVIFVFVLAKTKTGRQIYALGNNFEVAKLSGVNVASAQIKVYVFSAFLASVVGLMFTAKSGMGAMDAGTGYELNAVMVSVMGGISVMGGRGVLFGTVIGAFTWGVLGIGLSFAGASPAYKNIIIGALVIISVLIGRPVKRNRKVIWEGL